MEATSTDVRKNKDGSYTVMGAYNDGDTNIYVIIGKTKYKKNFGYDFSFLVGKKYKN